ncbi:hypothetical protein [Butyrivibrio sp. YAB3001]|uniref:hypothetical protein n=1 Tax=Butyrivibrio sp. YAB3001 TaxID=1520812 RepID=UPI0008F6433A|nr:hypothetical protein [Butyrivibrio sp. YAB3001]SFC27743.1 hypothetical protein SAMN02910398_01880 [Butyrivibrio sp. YAB3001]
MAKVLRRLLNEAKAKMTDEDFFTSKVMKQHFESIIEGVCKTFKRHIATSKMLLIISYGLPAAVGCGEELGKRDCQEVVKRYKKKIIPLPWICVL